MDAQAIPSRGNNRRGLERRQFGSRSTSSSWPMRRSRGSWPRSGTATAMWGTDRARQDDLSEWPSISRRSYSALGFAPRSTNRPTEQSSRRASRASAYQVTHSRDAGFAADPAPMLTPKRRVRHPGQDSSRTFPREAALDEVSRLSATLVPVGDERSATESCRCRRLQRRSGSIGSTSIRRSGSPADRFRLLAARDRTLDLPETSRARGLPGRRSSRSSRPARSACSTSLSTAFTILWRTT